MGWKCLPQTFLKVPLVLRSLWPILPRMRPSGLVMPSMASIEPLGFTERSSEGWPLASTYCVAIWPVSLRRSSRGRGATKRPSPWLMAMLWMSPSSHAENQGERFEAMRVLTSLFWWRPMALKVSVAH